MGIFPLLKGYFPEGSFVWLTFCYSVGRGGAKRTKLTKHDPLLWKDRFKDLVKTHEWTCNKKGNRKLGREHRLAGEPESSQWIIEDQAFSPSYDLAPSHSPHLPSVSSTGDTQEAWERETPCWREGEGEGVRSQWRRERLSLLQYNTFNTIWGERSIFL